jgi:hypothetical protein
MTRRHNNMGRILVGGIEANNRKKLIKSTSSQYIHWNKELRLPDDVLNSKKFPNVFEREESRSRPDIWFYSKEKRGESADLVLNLIEITISWNDAVINEGKFHRGGHEK